MGELTTIGKVLALIDGILAVVFGVERLLKETFIDLGVDRTGAEFGAEAAGGAEIGAIIMIVCGILMIMIYLGKINIKDTLALGIVVLIIALIGTTILGVLAGILIIIDALT